VSKKGPNNLKTANYKWIALSCTSLGALFSVLNESTLVIALPAIMKGLHANMEIIMWTIMSYMLILTILVPAIGRMADMIGRKSLYVGGFATFTVGSLLCGSAATGVQLLLFRIVQAIGGSLLLANSTAIVTDAFPRRELGKALGINGMIINIAAISGPILGGFLVNFGWRYIFYVNVPIGVAGTIWAWLQLRELDTLPENQKFDWYGTIIFSIGMLSLLLALTFGGFAGWLNGTIIGLFGLSIILLFLFGLVENRIGQPMLDMRLFKTRILAFAFGSNLLNGIARGAVSFLLIFYFQGIKGMDPLTAGILLAPFAIAMMVTSPISGWLSDKYGSRGLSSIGLLISAVGLTGFMRITEHSSISGLIFWMLVMGSGSGMFFSPNTSAVMGAVPVEKRGIAAGTRTMMNNAGLVISMGISMAIISSSISADALQRLFVGTQVGSRGIAVANFISGLRLAFTISFGFSLLAALISYLRGPKIVWQEEHIAGIPDSDEKVL
jgi:EmrB/QacA subfamily drug resistance transporter